MTIQLSKRVQNIKRSSTLEMARKARALKAAGKNLVDLGLGEPDFDTPDSIKAAAIQAIEAGFTKYTPVEGIQDLRQAISLKFKKDNNLNYETDQIMVSCGGKQTFFNMAQAVLNDGDEMILPAPYWVSYPDMAILAGAKPVIVHCGIEQNFKITAEQLEKAITPKTRLFVLNSPSNPSGMAYTEKELKALAEVLLRFPQILIASDDMYEKILWNQRFCNIVMACKELVDRTILLHGVSKTYAMTGWRIGFAAGPKQLIEAMTTIQSQSTSGPCSISQVAAKEALLGSQTTVEEMVASFKKRHDYLIPALNKLPGFQCLNSDGTFYAFPKVEEAIKRLASIRQTHTALDNKPLQPMQNDVDFAEFLLQECLLVTVPGSGFGLPGYLRLSFATSLENLQEAVARLTKILIQ